MKMAHFAALVQLELFRKNFFVILSVVTALASFSHTGHILVYAPRVVFILLPCYYTNYLEKTSVYHLLFTDFLINTPYPPSTS
ncbi:TPA: hypothetical protein ACS70C_002029 [Providencia alcalifaciens]